MVPFLPMSLLIFVNHVLTDSFGTLIHNTTAASKQLRMNSPSRTYPLFGKETP